MSLLQKRAEIKANHESMCKYHEFWMPNSRSNLDRDSMPLKDRPIMFLDKHYVFFVGDCVPQVQEAFKRFKELPPEEENWQWRASIAAIEDTTISSNGSYPKMTIHKTQTNDILSCLSRAGLVVVSTQAVPDDDNSQGVRS